MKNSERDTIAGLAKGAPAAIFGTGSSGLAAAELLSKLGIESVFYAQAGTKHDGAIAGDKLEPFGEAAAKRHRLVVYSPAFRPDHEWLRLAESFGAQTVCEPDLSALAWRGKILAITGTNGKTTLTSFLTHASNLAGEDCVAAGNIGTPLCAICAKTADTSGKTAVCELSSFQTFKLEYLKPDVLFWTNFAPDHLDWHTSMKEYFEAKYNLVKALKGDALFIGESVAEYADKFGFEIPAFAQIISEKNPPAAPAPFDSSIQAQNYAFARAYWEKLGRDPAILERAAASFSLPAYRFSKPERVHGMNFYNDSKATNVHAAVAALKELRGKENLVWLGGGKDKNCELDELVAKVRESACAAVLIGQTAEKLARALVGLPRGTQVCATMEEAVRAAAELGGEKANVLFSPAFSSFGMFSGYAERGKSFTDAVLCLKNSK